ncbi:MAG: MFS transporter [Coraliomargarita sp.]
MNMTLQHRRYLMGVVMFMMFIPPGMWCPALPNILEAYDARWVLPYATAIGPFLAMFSALFFGALSDRKMEAQSLLGLLSISGALFLWLSFSSLKWGWHPGWYLFFHGCNALISAPMFPLITKIKLANLPNAEKSFPLYSMCGTLGWIVAGCTVSWFALDASADAGRIGAIVRTVMGCVCFLMPATPPADSKSRGLRAALGLNAFGLLKDRELRAFYVASTMFAAPCVAFYMMVPTMLKDFGSVVPSAQMTLGQCMEILAMLFLSVVAGRFRMRWFLILAMALGVLRFALFALAGQLGMIEIIWLGIALHGPIYAFMTVTGRIFLDKRVPKEMSGQSQALYMFLTASVAGVSGAFVCEALYQWQVGGAESNWMGFWWLLAVMAVVPLAYFFVGCMGNSKKFPNLTLN